MVTSPKDYLTDRVADTEKLLKGYFSFSGKSPVEVIFSAGVNDTIVVLPWSVFIKAIEAFLTETITQSMEVGRDEGVKKSIDTVYAVYDKKHRHITRDYNETDQYRDEIVNELKSLSPKL